MALQDLTLANLAELEGGKIGRVFEEELERIRKDCADRPSLEAPRKLSIVIDIVPTADDAGDLDSVSFAASVSASVPKRKTRSYSALNREGRLQYNDLERRNPRQSTLDDQQRDAERRAAEEPAPPQPRIKKV